MDFTHKITQLDNGIRIITGHMPYVKTVSFGLWLDSGARWELPKEHGISHLIEHMMFQGTRTYTGRQGAEAIEALGGEINAYTGETFTGYHVQVLVENVHRAFKIFEDMMLNSLFDKKQIIREKKVVLQEIFSNEDCEVSDLVLDNFYHKAFPKQCVGGLRILGTKTSLSSFTREQLLAYKDKHYTPNRMVFSAAGAIEHDEFVAMVAENFAPLPSKERPDLSPLKYKGGVVITQRETIKGHLVLGFPGVSLFDEAIYTTGIISNVLYSRLIEEVREKRSMAYSVYCKYNCYLDGGDFYLQASTSPNRLLELLDVFYEQLHKMVEGVSEQEVELANTRIKSAYIINQEDDGSMGVCEGLAFEILRYGRYITFEEEFENYSKVTPTDVSSFTASILKGGRPTLSVVVGEKDDDFEHKIKEKLRIQS